MTVADPEQNIKGANWNMAWDNFGPRAKKFFGLKLYVFVIIWLKLVLKIKQLALIKNRQIDQSRNLTDLLILIMD